MSITGPTSPPVGHVTFCTSYPSECGPYDQPDAVVHLDEVRWNELVGVNAAVNATVAPVTDLEAFGVSEFWTFPTTVGDCEDYALEKRRILIQHGWPASALLMTVVRDEVGDGHAVLTVRTDIGDYVLDNRAGTVLLWNDTPYLYVKRQSVRHAAGWDAIDDMRAPIVGSVGYY